MTSEPRNYWVCDDTDFIGSEIGDDSEVGFLEFTDGVMLVCSVDGESSGDSDFHGTSQSLGEEDSSAFCEDVDWDDIPF